MAADPLLSPRHTAIRSALRLGGPGLAVVGLVLTAIGVGSFFAAFGTGEPPRYFWCTFVGLPVLAAGVALTKFGYLGVITRYVAGETAPVAKDAINYLGEGTQPGVRATARTVGEGLRDAWQQQPPSA